MSDALRAVRIGVLALQGAFAEHVAILRRLGADAVEVRTPAQLAELDGLILPGGESTTMGLVADSLQPFDLAGHEYALIVIPVENDLVSATYTPELVSIAPVIDSAKIDDDRLKEADTQRHGSSAPIDVRNEPGDTLVPLVAVAPVVSVIPVISITSVAVIGVTPVVRHASENVDVLRAILPGRLLQFHDDLIATFEIRYAISRTVVPGLYTSVGFDFNGVSTRSQKKTVTSARNPDDRSSQFRTVTYPNRSVYPHLLRIGHNNRPLLGTFIAENRQSGDEEQQRTQSLNYLVYSVFAHFESPFLVDCCSV